jgi:hypothetical protein
VLNVIGAVPPAGGAPLDQVIGATVAGLLLTVVLLFTGMRYRADRLPVLDKLAAPFGWLLRVPGWAALPAAIATVSLIAAGTGFYWDVAVHIDRGRDPGPFGTPAHFPILLGLFGVFAAGWLALAMAKGEEAKQTGIKITPTWTVPTSGVVMMAAGSFGLLGFPLDDVWHATFGQDVTLWGPTHLIMLTGGQLVIVTILALIGEGRAALRTADAPKTDGRLQRRILSVIGAGGVLAGLTIYQAEFGYGVPQYNLLFQPALLAFTGALALVFGRAVAGRGGALGAAVVNLIISGGFVVFVSPVMGQATPHFATYLPAALATEAAALVFNPKRHLAKFAAAAALLTATLGTLGEYLWTLVWMPIPWSAHFIPSAIEVAIPAAISGGLIGAFVARSLATQDLPRTPRPWLGAAVGLAGFAAILGFCLPTHVPAGATATVALDHNTGTTAYATVTFTPQSTVTNPDFVQQLSWQGHTRSVEALLNRIAPGVYRTTKPIPIAGNWKSLIRFQQGRARADVPIYMPADAAIPVPEIAAAPHITRQLVSDTTLMQRERKKGIPGWVWSAATTAVLLIIAALLVIIGWGLNRVRSRIAPQATPPRQKRRTVITSPTRPAGAPS